LGELNPEKIQIAKGAVNVEKIGMEVHSITDRLVQEYHIDSNVHGVVITKIEPGSISSEAALQVGDVIIGINRKEIQNINQFNDEIQNTDRGEDVLLYVNRNNVYFYVAFTMP
jgi:S1-C subfamily serine protease